MSHDFYELWIYIRRIMDESCQIRRESNLKSVTTAGNQSCKICKEAADINLITGWSHSSSLMWKISDIQFLLLLTRCLGASVRGCQHLVRVSHVRDEKRSSLPKKKKKSARFSKTITNLGTQNLNLFFCRRAFAYRSGQECLLCQREMDYYTNSKQYEKLICKVVNVAWLTVVHTEIQVHAGAVCNQIIYVYFES